MVFYQAYFLIGITLLKGIIYIMYREFERLLNTYTTRKPLYLLRISNNPFLHNIDVAVCQPFLTGPTAAICPRSNETITLICRDRQVVSMSWDVQPHHTYPDFKEEMIVYIPNDNNLIGAENIYGNFTGVLINITNKTNGTADLTSTLAVLTTGIYNGTNITCRTKRSAGLFNHSSVILNIAGAVT